MPQTGGTGALEASATSEWRNLQVQGLTGLGLVVQLPGNIQAANSSAVACLY